jgi:hypothetical protein
MRIPKVVAVSLLAAVCSASAQPMDAQMVDHQHMDHAAHMKMMEQANRQDGVAKRGPDVMPFSLASTTHIFTRTSDGGVQQVVSKKAADDEQVRLIRQHLQDIKTQFTSGDFSGPAHIHGREMPGLAELKAAKPGQITINYRDIKDGGELSYQTADKKLVTALHQWFYAQLSDHGKDAKTSQVPM